MQSDEIDYEISGNDFQIVEVELNPGETVIAEAGAMNYMEGGIEFESKMGDGSIPEEGVFPKMLNAGKRALTGDRKKHRKSDRKTSYSADVSFEFMIDGKKFIGNTIAFGGDVSSSSPSPANRITQGYPVGKEVDVYYQPEDPNNNVVEPGVTWKS